MAIPQLQQSCCCCSLQTGSKVIGWFQLVMGVIALIKILSAYANQMQTPRYEQGPEALSTAEVINIIILVVIIVSIIISIGMLIGTYKGLASLLMAWIVYNSVLMIVYIPSNLYISGVLLSLGEIWYGFEHLFKCIVVFGLQCYLWLVVYSHYQELKNKPENPIIYSAPYNPERNGTITAL